MKTAIFVFFALCLLEKTSLAAEFRTFQKTGPQSATVVIHTTKDPGLQAATYVDGTENRTYVDMMLADSKSELFALKAKLEREICGENSSTADGWIPTCGRVEVSNFTRTAFGRGGWMSAGASYGFFLGFRAVGSGNVLESYYLLLIGENAEAQVDTELNYLGEIKKFMTWEKVIPLPVTISR